MNITARTEDHGDIVAGAAPALARQLWMIWARQADEVACRLDAAAPDAEWRSTMTAVERTAEEMGARKVRTVARKAGAMIETRLEERAVALKALRVATRLDLETATH